MLTLYNRFGILLIASSLVLFTLSILDVFKGAPGYVATNSTVDQKWVNPHNDTYILYNGVGGIGNLLFGYASSRGIARLNNGHVLFSKSMLKLNELFPRLVIDLYGNHHKWKSRLIREKKSMDIDRTMFHLPKENVLIDGYLQSFLYFENISNNLISELKAGFKNEYIKSVNNFLDSQKKKVYSEKKNVTFVCVHVRRGDKIAGNHQKAGHIPAPAEAIQFAMDFMAKKHKDVAFIVTSDSLSWSYLNLEAERLILSNFSSPFIDFILLASCKNIIMTVGSFGWWASWLTYKSGGTVLYYINQVRPNSILGKEFNRSSHIPGDWLAYNSSTVIKSSLIN